MNWKTPALVAVPLLLFLAYVLYVTLGDDSPELPPAVVETIEEEKKPYPIVRESYEPTPTVDEELVEEGPPLVAAPLVLENSDEQVRVAILDIAPGMASWLIPDEQIRKWVLMVDLMADAKLPRRYRPIDYPMASFKVDEKDGVMVAAPANYERANLLIEQLVMIDPALMAKYYHQWQPIFEKAYRELGKPGSFDQRLRLSIERIIMVEPLQADGSVKRPGVFYQYNDPKLEKSPELSRLLWRLGPDNTAKLQAYLEQLANVL